jgi:hypothetical protein
MVKTTSKKVSSSIKKTSHRRMPPSELSHTLALAAAIECDGDMRQAAARFRNISKERPYPTHLKRFIQRVWDRYKSGDIKVAMRATPKRTKKISDELAEQASALFLQGVQGRSGRRPAGSAMQVSIHFSSQSGFPSQLLTLILSNLSSYPRHAWKMKV